MRQVQKNHGSAGVDHMQVTKLSELLSIDKEELTGEVRSGKYLPQPISGVEIPKGNNRVRLLGIPCVTDRLLQQAVMIAKEYINDGFQYIVDIDMKTFFDEVDHSYLLQLLYRKEKCQQTLRLIRKWLRSPIQIKRKLVKRRKGIPQGRSPKD